MIQNPVLKGFNPDPSMVRVGDDFYIVTSTFEWFPGVPLYHSRDLVHWRLVRNLLNTKEYLDLTGLEPSMGVWAPGLSYCAAEKRFYLVYTIVRTQTKWMFDADNFLIWTDDIEGEWSKPVYLNSSGFDPYLFCDDDGRKWLVNKDRDFRPENIDRRAIVIQEMDMRKNQLIGEPTPISMGFTERAFAEGANIYKKDGWYYLFLAEGGTGYAHCATMGRSRSVTGPYEACPHNPILTSAPGEFSATEKKPFMQFERYNPGHVLQKSGHGSLIETPDGRWYMSHLCGRPVMPEQCCVLGRETAIQEMEWTDDGWLKMVGNADAAAEEVTSPNIQQHLFPAENPRCDFSGGVIPPEFLTLRNEFSTDWIKPSASGSGIALKGRDTLTSNYEVSILARRLTELRAKCVTLLRFEPTHYRHMAGITCYYDRASHYCALKTIDENDRTAFLTVYGFMESGMTGYDVKIPVPAESPVYLMASVDYNNLNFSYSLDGNEYLPLGGTFDMTQLSDESKSPGRFTGTFVGMFAQDTYTKEKWAEFDYFEYLINP